MSEIKLDTLVSLAKRRGFVYPSSEIYGGLAGFYDFGPYGSAMAKNLRDIWLDRFVRNAPNIFSIDTSIIQNPKLWQASGHVDGFNDPMVDCESCGTRQRADHVAGEDTNDLKKLDEMLRNAKCPVCGTKGKFAPARTFNMMFRTYVGPTEEEDAKTYLRPETAGGIFSNFEFVRDATRAKLPFGIAQIGKAFRNEISARDFLFRKREFEQMEIEYFVQPENAEKELTNMKDICMKWLLDIGLSKDKLAWHQHTEDERAHYAADSWDIEYKYPFGQKELWGIANRTDYDLQAHSKGGGKELAYFDPQTNEHITPFVIEPSLGLDRLFLAVLDSAYTEEKVKDETRVVLKLDKRIAPVDVAVLPLSKNEKLAPLAKQVYQKIVSETRLFAEFDETQSIGKRYRRQDEIGTPLCVTVDFESIEDKSVTLRDRDTMKQERVKIEDLIKHL